MSVIAVSSAMRLGVMYTLVALVLREFSAWPKTAVLIADMLACLYLSTLFTGRTRWAFLLHPLVLGICSNFFETPFLQGGDGQGYIAAIGTYLDPSETSLNLSRLRTDAGVFSLLKEASFGILPILVLPRLLFDSPTDEVFYLWQGCFHVLLTAFALTSARIWDIPSKRYLLSIGLLTVIGPSFFDLGIAPTRHVVTSFALLLLYLSCAALIARVTLGRLLVLFLGIGTLLISKAQLLIPFLIFCVAAASVLKENRHNLKAISLLTLSVVSLLMFSSAFWEQFQVFQEISQVGVGTFGGLTQAPLVGIAVKYLFAILAPFPWSKATEFINTLYGGNMPLFVCHIASSFTGLYIATSLILRRREIIDAEPELRLMFLYGGVMSLSILRGATGFHTYLLVYFPFFAPLFTQRRFRVSWLLPIAVVLMLEVVVVVAR
jgi:hypothetical protein